MDDQPAVVLVHGAWGSPEMWDFVVECLPSEPEIIVADLPTSNRAGTDLYDDAAYVRDLVGGRRSILVGHSYGGAVITEAGDAPGGTEHLVYLAACMPDVGESMFDWVIKRPFPEPMPMEIFDDGTSLVTLEDDAPYDEPTMERLRTVRLRRFALAGLTVPVRSAAWASVPSTYVVTTRDTTFHPDTQREMAGRADAVTEIDAEHQVNVSHPEAVAALITSLLPA